MTLSGSFDYTVTCDEISEEALERCGAKEIGQPASEDLLETARRSLNLLMKAKQAAGLQAHTKHEATVFLAPSQRQYDIGPTGDDFATESSQVIRTTLGAAALALATTITLEDDTGIEDDDYIGIILDDGTIQWTTIDDVSAGTIGEGLTSAASAGNAVYTFTDKMQRPLKVSTFRLVDSEGNEAPLMPPLSREAYQRLPNKDSEGSPSQIYYDPQLENGVLNVWPVPEDAASWIEFTAMRPVDDLDESTDNLCVPQDWLEPLAAELAWVLAPKLAVPMDLRNDLLLRKEAANADKNDSGDGVLVIRPARRRR
jgi:hypothetical protein